MMEQKKVTDPTPRDLDAKGTLNAATQYIEASKCLLDDENGWIKYMNPFNYLASHAFELTLKAYLVSKGYEHDRLKKEFRHDVKKLLNECANNGMEIENEFFKISETIANLNALEMQRYPKLGLFLIGEQGFAEAPSIINYVEKFHKKVGELISDQKKAD